MEKETIKLNNDSKQKFENLKNELNNYIDNLDAEGISVSGRLKIINAMGNLVK